MQLRSIVLIFIIASLSVLSFASIQVNGTKTWSIGYGFGDQLLLNTLNYYCGLNLDQSLNATVFGTQYATIANIPIGIKIDGTFNDHNQLYYKLSMDLFKNDIHLILGDYDHRINKEYLQFGDHLKGVALKKVGKKLNYFLGISQVEGQYKTKTFNGQTLSQHLEFNEYNNYLSNSRGLESKTLDFNFVYDYTRVYLKFTDIASLTTYLNNYNMGYLIDFNSTDCSISIKSDGKYRIENYIVIPNNVLLLTESSTDILRDSIKYYINRYNDYKKLNSDNKKEYLNQDKDAEFLIGLRKYVQLYFQYPDKSTDFSFKRNGLYFDLINSNILPESIKITTTASDDIQYTLINYKVLKLNKRLKEFDVDYQYSNTNSVYFLGFNVIPNSESVYLNNKLLNKGVDYYIDYNSGFLTVFKELNSTDTLKVNYQISTSSFGSNQYYNTYVFIGSLNYNTKNIDFSLNNLSSFESTGKVDDYLIPIMPNNEYSTDLYFKYHKNNTSIKYEGEINYQDFENPNKNKEPLKMTNVIQIYDYYIMASNNGIVVFEDGKTYNFTAKDGISSNMINDACLANNVLYLATDNGISYIDLSNTFGESMDKIFSKDIYSKSNWKYYSKENGLDEDKINSITNNGTEIYVATNNGIYKLENTEFEKIINGDISEIRFYNADMYYIENNTLYKNSKVFLKDIHRIKIHDGKFYIFGDTSVYDQDKNVLLNKDVYDYLKTDDIQYYSTATGLYAGTELISSGTYYYIDNNIAVGNSIFDIKTATEYTLSITSNYYEQKEKIGYWYTQNHLTLNFGMLTLDFKKDLKDKYCGLYINSAYENQKIQLKYQYKYYNKKYSNLYSLYLGSDLLNIQGSISKISSSVSINSKYSTKNFTFINQLKYENNNFYYNLFGENTSSIGLIKKLNYSIKNTGAVLFSQLHNKVFDSKIDIYYTNRGLEKFFINPLINYKILGLSLQSYLKIQYPSVSNHIYTEARQIVSTQIFEGNLSLSLSLIKDFLNTNSINIYPLNLSYADKINQLNYKINIQNIYYAKDKILQQSKDLRLNLSLNNLSFMGEYKNDEHFNIKYIKISASQLFKIFETTRFNINLQYNKTYYPQSKNSLSSSLKFEHEYKNKNTKLDLFGITNFQYNILENDLDYSLYFGAKISLYF